LKKAIIFGTGDFGKVVYFYLKNDSSYKIEAFTATSDMILEEKLFGLPIIPFENIEERYSPKEYQMFIAVPYTKMNKIREKFFLKAKEKGYSLLSYVNSKATVWSDLNIGENCFVLENNVIQPYVEIGNNVILWSGNHIGHHSKIKDNCFIASQVVISGKVTIEQNCFLGVNSTIRDGITINKECVIGAGAVILNDTKDKQVYNTTSTKLLDLTSDKLKHL